MKTVGKIAAICLIGSTLMIAGQAGAAQHHVTPERHEIPLRWAVSPGELCNLAADAAFARAGRGEIMIVYVRTRGGNG